MIFSPQLLNGRKVSKRWLYNHASEIAEMMLYPGDMLWVVARCPGKVYVEQRALKDWTMTLVWITTHRNRLKHAAIYIFGESPCFALGTRNSVQLTDFTLFDRMLHSWLKEIQYHGN